MLELLANTAAHVAHGDPSVLRQLLHNLDELLAAFGGDLGKRQTDHHTVVARIHAEITRLDRLLDRFQRTLVVRRNDQNASLGNGEAGQLLQRHLGAVVVDPELLHERGRGPPGPDAAELILEVDNDLVHLVVCLRDPSVGHLASLGCTSVPIGSPVSALVMLPACITSKTMIGKELSMQNVIAVESMTWSPRARTSKWLSFSIFTALGSVRGSAL